MKTEQNKGTISRREVLKIGAIAATSSALPVIASGKPVMRGPAIEAVTRTSPKNIRISLAAYSVRKVLSSGSMDLFDFIDWCADLDLAGTELTSYYFKEGFDKSYLHQLKLHAFRSGVTVSGTAVRNNFCLPPGRERDKEIAHVRQWVDHAVEFFAPHIRIFAGRVPEGVDKKTAIGWVADAIKDVLQHAAKRGVVIGLENHGGITARAADHLAICDAVGDHPWFGINLDTGNYGTNVYQELAMAAPRSVNVQVKVKIAKNDGTRVPADFERIKKILLDAGYKGWVALEYEAESNPRREIPKYVKQLKQLFEVPV
ncbi:sugar phosphate isomerase/epimerase [Acidobacteria bacterium AH-259-A15]|nr:sugar phosphate isomerase/epimerase [Acidobacteria bacterium AH-259-A15]